MLVVKRQHSSVVKLVTTTDEEGNEETTVLHYKNYLTISHHVMQIVKVVTLVF